MTAPDQHRYNRRLFLNDNLPVMINLDAAIADAIITDPPFNSNRFYEHNFGSKTTDKKGKKKPGFKDIWTLDAEREEEHKTLIKKHPDLYQLCAFARQAHSVSMQAYLIFMSLRILECHRLLKETGSMFLHCDPTANGYLRMLMDCVFGQENFLNEIAWCYRRWSGKTKHFQRMHDTILYYAKKQGKHTWTWPMEPKAAGTPKHKRWNEIDEETGQLVTKSDKDTPVTHTAMRDVFEISRLQSQAKERAGWKTQKPLKLYTRLVLACTNPGDLVIDPFCGCATTIVAAENNGRQWIGIDRDETAWEALLKQLGKLNENSEDFWRKTLVHPRKSMPRKLDTFEPLTPAQRKKWKKDLYADQDQKCAGCDYRFEKWALEMDHDVPKSKGGEDVYDNFQLLCPRCNRRKGNRLTLAQLRALLRKEGLLYEQRNEVYFVPSRLPAPRPPKRVNRKQTKLKLKEGKA